MASAALRLCHISKLQVRNLKQLNFFSGTAITCFHTCQKLLGDPVRINMPSLSPTMEVGTVIKWHKKEGETITPGDMLCEIQTDKAVVAFDTEEEGILAKILTKENEETNVGNLIALMVEEGDDWQNVAVPNDDQPEKVEKSAKTPTVETTPSRQQSLKRMGPAVRTLLDVYQLHGADIQPSGAKGMLVKGDVLKYIKEKHLKPPPVSRPAPPSKREAAIPATSSKSAASPPIAPARSPLTAPVVPAPPVSDEVEFVDHELTSMRKTIAKRLTESKTTIPHSYASVSCNMYNITKLRKELRDDGVKVSVNDFIIKAAAIALQQVPTANAVWTGTDAQPLADIDISIAVATDSGLITPIVRDAVNLGLAEISATVKDLSSRAREGKLKLQEFQGGSFTISNLGMFGITEFSAVINPPQACILAVGGSQLTLAADGTPQTLMNVTLSADARIVDDVTASTFLQAFQANIENPMNMITRVDAKQRV